MGFALPPRPVSSDQKYLAAVVDRLDSQNELLTRILDRLPESPAVGDGRTVELREPSVHAPPAKASSPEPPPTTARSTRKTVPRTKPKGTT
jgi:hypothetical protein